MELKIEDGELKNYTGRAKSSLTIPPEVKILGSWSLDSHPELYEIVLPETVQKINYHVFYEDDNLRSVVVDRRNGYFTSVGSASENILCNKQKTELLCCPNGLESVYIPASITSMKETDAFAGCKKIKKITVDKNNKNFTVLNGILYEHDGYKLTRLVRCPVDKESVQIPESVSGIYNHAFEGCAELREIRIPEGIKELKSYTFKHCHQLEQVQFPKHLVSIGDSCFRECHSLKEVVLPDGLKTIIPGAFSYCRSMKKLVIPESVRGVGYIAYECESMETLSCQGIVLEKQNIRILSERTSEIISLMINKDFDETRIAPEIKYQIIYEMFIRNQDDKKTNAFIKNNFDTIVLTMIEADQFTAVQGYVNAFRRYLNAQNLDRFIQTAIEKQKYEIQIYLTNIKYKRNDFTQKDWSL